MTSLKIVIADDLTGACDVGVQFGKAGHETLVFTDIETLEKSERLSDVIVIDTESRNLAPEAAYTRIRQTLNTLMRIDFKLVYKKIDSTFRGNVGAELEAVLDKLDIEAIVVAPAYPAQNRTTLNGHILVNDKPLERTEYARDLLYPLNKSYIKNLLSHQTKSGVGSINLPTVRSGINALKMEIQRLIKDGNRILVVDAEIQEDLTKIAKASLDLNLLPCGSAGLAEEVARFHTSRSRILVVSGSVNRVTLAQIVTAEHELHVKVVEPDLSEVLLSREKLDDAAENLFTKVKEALLKSDDIVIRLVRSKDHLTEIEKTGHSLGMSNLQVTDRLLTVLSKAFNRIIQNHIFTSLILIGGDTSIKILEATGAEGIRIEDEILPGIPIGRILGGTCEGMKVITKAGGFGDEHTLIEIIKFLISKRDLEK